jgi:glycosyltransferase involved in cell wall biosynthesis
MKIMYVVRSVSAGGGMTIVEIIKANAFVEKDHEVIICYTNSTPQGAATLRPISPKVKLIDLDQYDNDIVPFTKKFFKHIKQVYNKLQNAVYIEKPDVIVATDYSGKYVVPFIKAPKGHKMVKVREYHYSSTKFKQNIKDKWVLLRHKIYHYFGTRFQSLRYDKIYILTKRDKRENYPTNGKYDVMPNPLTLNILPPPDFTLSTGILASYESVDSHSDEIVSRKKTVLFVGRLDSEKNIQGLLRIWAKTTKGDWILKIVGDGPLRKTLENQASALKISNSVNFTGWISDPSAMMRNASLLCLTSFHEGFPLVIAEAMSQGLPVVAYDLPYGPSDIINDGINGLLIPYLNEDIFAKKLSHLISDANTITKMSKSAIERSNDFSVDRITDLWIEKYTELYAQK